MAIKSGSDYKGLLYNFTSSGSEVKSGCTTTTSEKREPDIVSRYDNDTSYNNGLFTKSSLQQEYNKMIESVSKYHGFYVARYELGLEGTLPVSKNASTNTNVTTADASNSNTNMWYGLYSKSKEYAPEDGDNAVVSSMMWGSQYDAMMNWMQKNGENVTSINDSKRNTTEVTGSNSNDVLKNIYDLYGCHRDWTLEAYGTSIRANRGGGYDGALPPSYNNNYKPNEPDSSFSTRLTLYIKTGEENKENIQTTDSYVGYYADLEGDGTVDGIIYADLAVGGSGKWNNDSYSGYEIPKVTSGLKEYYVSKTNYQGAFGTKDVISPNGSGTDRFYVMALNDIDSSSHYWYYSAYDRLGTNNWISPSENDFEEGKTNTTTRISNWNSSYYGEQNSNDMWGLSLVQEQANKGWFIPSKSEWAAFGGELRVTTSNYTDYGLKNNYWSSTLYNARNAYNASFNTAYIGTNYVSNNGYVRMGTTF